MQDNQEYKTALPGFFTVKELSDILEYSNTSYLSRLCRAKKITAYQIGTQWFIEYNQGIELIKNKK